MTYEKDIGRLLGLMETVREDISEIKNNMVTRQEFETVAAEHDEFRQGISDLKTSYDRGHIVRRIADRALYVVVGLAITGGAVAFGLG